MRRVCIDWENCVVDKIIVILMRKKLGLKKYEKFRFTNQKDRCIYYFNDRSLIKVLENKREVKSGVALNWLLDKRCKITKKKAQSHLLMRGMKYLILLMKCLKK